MEIYLVLGRTDYPVTAYRSKEKAKEHAAKRGLRVIAIRLEDYNEHA